MCKTVEDQISEKIEKLVKILLEKHYIDQEHRCTVTAQSIVFQVLCCTAGNSLKNILIRLDEEIEDYNS